MDEGHSQDPLSRGRWASLTSLSPSPFRKTDRRVRNRLGARRTREHIPRGKPWDRQRISGKLRRKFMSVPGLRRISAQRPQNGLAPVSRLHASRCRLQVMALTRRTFAAAVAAGFALSGRSHGMSIHLSCGALGIKASQSEAIDYAARYGFDSVDADGRYLGDLPPADLARLRDNMRAKIGRAHD